MAHKNMSPTERTCSTDTAGCSFEEMLDILLLYAVFMVCFPGNLLIF